MNGLIVAARYLTIVPFPGRTHAAGVSLGGAAIWFPLVGLALGLVLAAVDRVSTTVFPPLLATLITVTAWKLFTGGLHLDGLADCFDGLMGRDPEHRLAIMRDSRIGAFGAIGLVLFLLLEVVAIAELPDRYRWRALVAAPAAARALAVVVARLFPPARRDGQGATFQLGVRPRVAAVTIVAAAVVAGVVLGPAGLVALALTAAAVLAIVFFLARRLGGITGDVLGAGVETAELAFLLTVSAWAHAQG